MSDTTTPNRRPVSKATSPTAANRADEKRELGELNGRLERYITAVKTLHTEKQQLSDALKKAQELKNLEGSKKVFEDKIKQLRSAKEELQKEGAILKMQLRKKEELLAEMEPKVIKLTQLKDVIQKKVVGLEAKVPELEDQYSFLSALHDDEINALRTILSDKSRDVESLKNNFNGELLKELEKAKKGWAADADKERAAIFAKNKDQLQKLEVELGNGAAEGSNLKGEIAALKAEASALKDKISNAHKENQVLRSDFTKTQNDAAAEVSRLQQQLAQLTNDVAKAKDVQREADDEVRELSSDNFRLDHEIMEYRRLISGEESRLKLPLPSSPVGSPMASGSGAGSAAPNLKKRKFEDLEEEDVKSLRTYVSKSGIANIEELNVDGRFIKVVNMTSSDIHLDGWYIQAGSKSTGEDSKFSFKFADGVLLTANGDYIVRVKVSQGAESQPEPSSLTFPQALIAPGSFLNLYNDANEVISTLEIVEAEDEGAEGTFGRVCNVM